ncbi:MAG: DeoR/GlpR transcriptional regulator [Clostridiales bacterium]|nr:DeoR/GlpR transcriptional regulator [Clostridiales bacterium]
MYIEERHQAILEIIKEKGSISTSEIQRKFGVGYDSAKRDLRILEEKGLLKRTHGGAIGAEQVALGRPPKQTIRDMSDVKANYLAIAKYAVSLIKENDVIFISSASVGLLMVKNLPSGFNVRIVTNSIILADELRSRDNVRVILIGGEMDNRGNCYEGFALDMLSRLRFDKCFLTSAGISADFGLSIQHSSAIQFWNAVIDASKQAIGLYPTEKLGHDSIVSICPAERLDCIITDWDANEETLAEFEERDVKVVVVDEENE